MTFYNHRFFLPLRLLPCVVLDACVRTCQNSISHFSSKPINFWPAATRPCCVSLRLLPIAWVIFCTSVYIEVKTCSFLLFLSAFPVSLYYTACAMFATPMGISPCTSFQEFNCAAILFLNCSQLFSQFL